MTNSFKRKIESGGKCVGTFFELGGSNAAECAGASGMDFIIIDAEHGPYEAESAADIVRASCLRNITPFARVKDCSRPAVLKMLDVGVQGLIVPCVNTVEEVHSLVENAKYFPVGKRGVMWGRDALWGEADYASDGLDSYFRTCNSETLLIPQCETSGALEHIEEITSIEGVDGIFIGPYDLSVALGRPGDFESAEFKRGIDRAFNACVKHGKISMIYVNDSESASGYLNIGFDAVTVLMDTKILISGLRNLAESVRKGVRK